ncbi:o-succinylbenzoate--CoA ligase [Vibrio sp. E150_011]
MNNATGLNAWVRQTPNETALLTPDGEYSWQQVQRVVSQYQLALVKAGVEKNTVVCLIGRAEPALLFAYLACLAQGCLPALVARQPVTGMNAKLTTLYSKSERAYLWWCSDTAREWSASSFDRDVTFINTQPIEGGCEHSEHEQAVNDDAIHGNVMHGNTIHDYAIHNNAIYELSPHQIASIIFTSGSTGKPKAVVHTIEQHLASATGLLERFAFSPSDRWLLSLPMFHVSGLAIVWRWLSTGAQLKVGGGQFCEDISDVSHASLVVTQLKRIIDQRLPNQLKRVLLGGSHISNDLIQSARELGIDMWMGYGMTETASTVTAKQANEDASSGIPLPHREVKLIDGHIWVKGSVLSSGYYQQGNILPLALVDCWFDTKDLGRWSAAQELQVIGRADNLFISGGENIHCEEIEAVLNARPEVVQSIVVPVRSDDYGARPVAVVQRVNDQVKLKNDQLDIDLTTTSLAKFKHPVAYYDMPESLLSSGIKVSRAQVKSWLSSTQSNYVVIS